MIPVQIRVTKKLIERIDYLIEEGIYSNRSEAVRDAIRKHFSDMPIRPEAVVPEQPARIQPMLDRQY